MRVTWGHLAGFVCVSALIFALGIVRGQQKARETSRQSYLNQPGPYEHQVAKGLNKHELAFVDRVPAYPRRLGPEIPTGTHRDAFGLPTRSKKFDSRDEPDEILAWYERHFQLKSMNVYKVENEMLSGLGALDLMNKQMYYITAVRQRSKTMVICAWSDGTKAPDKRSHLIPLEVNGGERPLMLSGDGKSHETAVYLVDDAPKRAYSRIGKQLGVAGWAELEAPAGDVRSGKLREFQRTYQKQGRELTLTARKHDGKTVVICMVAPRVG